MNEKELSPEEINRLQELSGQWWELDKDIAIRMDFVISKQEAIEAEILSIVLGERQ